MRWILALVLLVACSRQSARPNIGESFAGSLTPSPGSGAEVVATVDDAQIFVADVEALIREKNLSVDSALSELIQTELLAREAYRRGLCDDPEVVDARKRARVRALILHEFVRSFDGPEDVPAADVDAVWEKSSIASFYNHDEYHEVTNVLVSTSTLPPDEAHALAEEIHRIELASRPKSKEEFIAIANEVAKKQGRELKTEDVSTTRNRSPIVQEFADAAFSVNTLGDIAGPVKTSYGWHVIYLYKILPERRTTKEQATPEIREKVFESARRRAFLSWADGIASRVRTSQHDELLERVEVESSIGQAK